MNKLKKINKFCSSASTFGSRTNQYANKIKCFDRTNICVFKSAITKHKFLCLMASLRSLPAFVPPRNDPQESSLGYITKICSSSNVIRLDNIKVNRLRTIKLKKSSQNSSNALFLSVIFLIKLTIKTMKNLAERVKRVFLDPWFT